MAPPLHPSIHPFIHPLILLNKHLNNYIWWSIGLTHTQSRRNPLHLHALLARFLLSLRSKPPTTQRHSVLPLIPLLILPQRTRIYRRRALPFFSLLNPPTTRKASKKSCRWMGRIFPASTCIKSSTSRIYASLASLLAPYRTHRGLLTQTLDIRSGIMLTAIQNDLHIFLVQLHFLTLQQDFKQLKSRSFIRQRNLRPTLLRSPT